MNRDLKDITQLYSKSLNKVQYRFNQNKANWYTAKKKKHTKSVYKNNQFCIYCTKTVSRKR